MNKDNSFALVIYSLRAVFECIYTAFCVTAGVTNGFPSRSPPIQEPNLKKLGTLIEFTVSESQYIRLVAFSKSLYICGTALKREVLK